jgi:hypothetical protein
VSKNPLPSQPRGRAVQLEHLLFSVINVKRKKFLIFGCQKEAIENKKKFIFDGKKKWSKIRNFLFSYFMVFFFTTKNNIGLFS